MKGQIILPIFYKTRYTDNYKFLLRAIADKYGLSYSYFGEGTNDIIIDDNTELVITFAIPQHNRFGGGWNQFLNLPKHIKLIAWLRDIHCYDDPDCHAAICAMMDRADAVLSNSNTYFEKMYPEYIDKMFFMGDFFAPHERYAKLGFNSNPDEKCFLSGAISKKTYPLRNQILFERDSHLIGFLPPPKKKGTITLGGETYDMDHPFVGNKYAELLHRFFCCVTCCSIYEYALSKHMEIPAAGSLLITNTCNDLIQLGYEPMKHFVPITKDDATDTIYKVLGNPQRYEHIRKEGWEFVHKNHSIVNRIEELSRLIEKVV